MSAKAVDLNVLLEEKCPKKFLFPLLTLLWATFSSYTTLALTMAVGCIGVQVPKRWFSRRVGLGYLEWQASGLRKVDVLAGVACLRPFCGS